MRITVRKGSGRKFDVLVEPARRSRLPVRFLPNLTVNDIESVVGPVVERNTVAELAGLAGQGRPPGLNGPDIP